MKKILVAISMFIFLLANSSCDNKEGNLPGHVYYAANAGHEVSTEFDSIYEDDFFEKPEAIEKLIKIKRIYPGMECLVLGMVKDNVNIQMQFCDNWAPQYFYMRVYKRTGKTQTVDYKILSGSRFVYSKGEKRMLEIHYLETVLLDDRKLAMNMEKNKCLMAPDRMTLFSYPGKKKITEVDPDKCGIPAIANKWIQFIDSFLRQYSIDYKMDVAIQTDKRMAKIARDFEAYTDVFEIEAVDLKR